MANGDIDRAKENGLILGGMQAKIKVLCDKSNSLERKMETGFKDIDTRLDAIQTAQVELVTTLKRCPIVRGENSCEASNPRKSDKLRKLKLWAIIVTAVVGGGVTLPVIVKLLDGLFSVLKNATGIGG